jgi:FkbM family methyltransferase
MHVGLWSMHLARVFKIVIGFEPMAEHIECLKLNMGGLNNYLVHQCALGNRSGIVGLRFLIGSMGSTQIDDNGSGVEMKCLDDFSFEAVDFLKIDVEAYESFVVEGGEQTIKRHKPVIIIEQKPNTNPNKLTYGRSSGDARRILESWGAKQKFEIAGDYCFGW